MNVEFVKVEMNVERENLEMNVETENLEMNVNMNVEMNVEWRGGGLGSRPIFKKFHETYAPS